MGSARLTAAVKEPSGCSLKRSKVNATSSAVNGSPLCQTALSTSSSVQVRSSSCVQLAARPGSNPNFSLMYSSEA
jgi:hypothetical protein